MRRAKTFVLATLFGLALAAGPAFSQSLTGAITGRAIDSSGAVLARRRRQISSPPMIGGARRRSPMRSARIDSRRCRPANIG